MALAILPDDHIVDPNVSCSRCDAVCCRLTVVLLPGDIVAEHLIEHGPNGVDTLLRAEDGWCVAMDREKMCCSIYEQRPLICRKFTMGSGYCRHEREKFRVEALRRIPLSVVDGGGG